MNIGSESDAAVVALALSHETTYATALLITSNTVEACFAIAAWSHLLWVDASVSTLSLALVVTEAVLNQCTNICLVSSHVSLCETLKATLASLSTIRSVVCVVAADVCVGVISTHVGTVVGSVGVCAISGVCVS